MATIKQCMTQLYYMVIARILLNIVQSEKPKYGCHFPNWNSEQQSMQSVPITTKVVTSNPAHGELTYGRSVFFFRLLRFRTPIKLTSMI